MKSTQYRPIVDCSLLVEMGEEQTLQYWQVHNKYTQISLKNNNMLITIQDRGASSLTSVRIIRLAVNRRDRYVVVAKLSTRMCPESVELQEICSYKCSTEQ